jgi:magnesium-transporting ATPase (P-type)
MDGIFSLFRSAEIPAERRVYLNNPDRNDESRFCHNRVSTSLYTFWNFLPIFLFMEFRQIPNLYFLVVGILQILPATTSTGGVPTNFVPLTFVILVDALFALLEDLKRHQADHEANSCRTQRLKHNQFTTSKWYHVQVGDIIKVSNREVIPADLVILAVGNSAEVSTTHPQLNSSPKNQLTLPSIPQESTSSGICYVETKSLDGETNLKLRQAVKITSELVFSDSDCHNLKGFVRCEQPNNSVNSFTGSLYLGGEECEGARAGFGSAASRVSNPSSVSARDNDSFASRPKANSDAFSFNGSYDSERSLSTASQSASGGEPLQLKNMLLRGVKLRNTPFVYGLVVNTGHDTKIMQAVTRANFKRCSLEKVINRVVLKLLVLVFFLCLLGSSLNVMWQMRNGLEGKPAKAPNDKWYCRSSHPHPPPHPPSRFTTPTLFCLCRYMYGVRDDSGNDTDRFWAVQVTPGGWLVGVFYYFVFLADMLPISLYVSLQTVRFIQAHFMQLDLEMYHGNYILTIPNAAAHPHLPPLYFHLPHLCPCRCPLLQRRPTSLPKFVT